MCLEQLEPSGLVRSETLLVGEQSKLDLRLAVRLQGCPVAIGDGDHHVPVGPPVTVVPRLEQPDIGEPAATQLLPEDRPMIPTEQVQPLFVMAPLDAVVVR